MTVIKQTPFVPEGPQPLLRSIPKGRSFPTHALGPFKEAVEAVHKQTQAPVAIAAQSALSVASMATQAHANVQSLGGEVPLSLFALTIAQSGERKSACDRLLMQGLREHERDRMEAYRVDMADWRIAHKVWTAKRDRLVKETASAKAEKAVAASADLDALGPEPAQPLLPKLTTAEPTLEGLVKLYMTGQPSLGLFSDEGGGFLGGHAMNSDNRLKTIAGLSSLWGGDPLDRVRSGDGATTLFGRRLAMHLMVQPVAARPLLSDPLANGQGFLARFLITEPPSAIGTRLDRPESVARVAEVAMGHRLKSLLDRPKPISEDTPQELDPPVLALSSEADHLLYGYYSEVEAQQAPGGQLEHVRAYASKSPEQAARLAGVMTIWQDMDAKEISGSTMADAITLATFYLDEARRLSEAATISAETEAAELLRQWLLERWPRIAVENNRTPQTIIPRDIVRWGPNSMRETTKIRKLMNALSIHGWLQELEKGTEVDGQSRQLAYRVVS
ncbi:MAG: YfjI family protein [Pseudomonadota bacterium]